MRVRVLKVSIFCLIGFLFVYSNNVFGVENPVITPELSKQIVDKIRAGTIQINRKYKGAKFVEDVTTQIFNSKTGELDETTTVLLLRRMYNNKEAEITPLTYYKDGKKQPLSDYKSEEGETIHNVFDENGEKYYNVKVIGYKKIGDQDCYQLKVIPKGETAKHIIGDMYFTTDSLEIVLFKGTLGSFPFGVKNMNITANYFSLKGYSVPSSSLIEVFVHIPFVFSNKKLVIKSVTSSHKLLSVSD